MYFNKPTPQKPVSIAPLVNFPEMNKSAKRYIDGESIPQLAQAFWYIEPTGASNHTWQTKITILYTQKIETTRCHWSSET